MLLLYDSCTHQLAFSCVIFLYTYGHMLPHAKKDSTLLIFMHDILWWNKKGVYLINIYLEHNSGQCLLIYIYIYIYITPVMIAGLHYYWSFLKIVSCNILCMRTESVNNTSITLSHSEHKHKSFHIWRYDSPHNAIDPRKAMNASDVKNFLLMTLIHELHQKCFWH